jgi:hypothetical protein
MEQRGPLRVLALVGAAVVVLGALVFGTVAGRTPERAAPPRHTAPPETRSQAALFSCPELHPVFTRHVPPIMEIGRERAIAARVSELSGSGWSVAFAEPTRLGVFAFVDGDLAAAKPVVLDAGATHVWANLLGSEVGTRADIVEQALNWALAKPMRDVRRALHGLTDDGDLAYWNEAGAIFVQWKRPLPPQVAALAELRRPDGVLVVVEETPYSARELQAAPRAAFTPEVARDIGVELTSARACGDLSGIIVGVEPEQLGDRAPRLQEQLSAITHVPVHVVAEAAPIFR